MAGAEMVKRTCVQYGFCTGTLNAGSLGVAWSTRLVLHEMSCIS